MSEQKTALVTASTRGIGKAIGKALLERGCYVFFNYAHSDGCAKQLTDELNLAGHKDRFSIIRADLSSYGGVETLSNGINRYIDYLILNAGATCRTPFPDITTQEWGAVIRTNLTIPFFTLQKLDFLLASNGRVILIGALMGEVPHAISIPYAVSKAGLHMLAKSLVKHYRYDDITINVIAPGFINTEWHESKDDAHRGRIEQKIALRRFGRPEEVAAACLAVIDNPYFNGAVLNLDGGYDME
jgi:3-oxoacyl-[acyl-carrier protein] reductase